MNPELEAKLSALLDGELAPAEVAALRDEIARSPELAERLAELAAVDDALRALPARPVPPALRARIAERIGAGGSVQARRATRRAPACARRWLAAAALAAAAAALALVWLPRLHGEETQVAAEDLPVIEVLDVLAELDELEGAGSG